MIMVRRVYTPKPGGGRLAKYLKDLQEATAQAGFPPLTVYRKILGSHGTMVTEQLWPSITAYDESRTKVRQTKPITDVFGHIYPVLATTHLTEVYEVVD